MNKKIAIIGAGGHGKVVGEIAMLNEYEVINFFDDQENNIKEFLFTPIKTLEYLNKNLKDYDAFFVAIGDNQARSNKIKWLKELNVNIVNLVHPKSSISKFSSLGMGTCVMANAAINAGTFIKEGVIVNTSASIDHDCTIGDFSHISPNCSLSGGVSVGKLSHIGTGTSVHPGIRIGNYVKIGVGSKIYKNISDQSVYNN